MTATPIDRDGWLRRVMYVAPHLPIQMVTFLAAALADPNAGSDALLWLADALEQASTHYHARGQFTSADEMHAAADLPRQLAPLRAWQRTPPALERPAVELSIDASIVEGVIEPDGTVTVTVPVSGRPAGVLRGLPLRLRRVVAGRSPSEPKG